MASANYTIYRDERVNRFIQDQLDIVVDALLRSLGSRVDTILLCGGFGRGEGSIIVSDNGMRVVNDYDITILMDGFLVLNYRRFAPKLYRLAAQLASCLRIKQIDFSIRHRRMLEEAIDTSVAYYELLAGHKVLYGEPLRPALADVSLLADRIPLTEGTVYFLNRGSGLLIAALYLFLQGAVQCSDIENFFIEVDKGIIAIGDALLISMGAYHYSYQERLRRMKALSMEGVRNGPRLRCLYELAMENKLRPKDAANNRSDPWRWWFEVQTLFGEFFHEFESRRLDRSFDNWLQYSHIIIHDWKFSYARCGQKVLLTSRAWDLLRMRYWNDIRLSQQDKLLQVMPLLLFSINQSGFDERMLKEAANLLGFRPKRNGLELWRSLVNRYLLLYHPSGAAGEIARRSDRFVKWKAM